MEFYEEESRMRNMQRMELRRHILSMQEGGSISIPKFLAAASRVVEFEFGHSVRTVQLIAVLAFCQGNDSLRGRLAQVLTGEGKTLIIALLVLKLAVIDQRKVDVVTSNKSLAERDARQFRKLAAWFQVSVGHITKNSDPALYSKSQVVYSDCHQMQFDVLKYDLNQVGGRSGRIFDVVLADEVDNLFIDRLLHGTRISHPVSGGELFIPIWLSIFSGVDTGLEDEEILQNMQRRIENEWLLPTSLRTFAKKNLHTWIDNAHRAIEKLERDCDYIIEDGKVIIVDSDHTGQVMHGVQWSESLMQMVQIKERLAVSTESLTIAHISNLSFFRRYSTIYGLSGTLGTEDESQTLGQLYQVDSWKIPPHKPKKFRAFAPRVVSTHQDWFRQIVESVAQQTSKNRAVLVVCEYIDDASKLQEELQQRGCRNIIMYTRDDNEETAAPERELKAGDVVVATNIGGRGTDFKVQQIVNNAGGLHVILTYLPLNSRVEHQAFGRTARSGSPGSGEMIVYNREGRNFVLLKLIRDYRFRQHVDRLEELVGPEERRSKLFQDFAKLMVKLQGKAPQKLDVFELAVCQAAKADIRHSWQLIFGDNLETSEQKFAELEATWRQFVENNGKAAHAPFCHPTSLVLAANDVSSLGQHDAAEKLYQRALTLDDQKGDLAIAAALIARVANSIRAQKPEKQASEYLSHSAELIDRHWENWLRAYGRAMALVGTSSEAGKSSLQDRIVQRVEALELLRKALEQARADLKRSNLTVTFDVFPHHIDSDIQKEFEAMGFQGLLRIMDFWDKWGPSIVIVLGLLEILAAALVVEPGLASALAKHGADDLICGVKAAWEGKFDSGSYAYQKSMKVFLTACTEALNDIVQPDAQEAAKWTQDRLQARAKAVGEKVAKDILVEMRDTALDVVLDKISPECIDEWICQLYACFLSKYRVKETLQKLVRSNPEFEQKLVICLLFDSGNAAALLLRARLDLESGKHLNEAANLDLGLEDFSNAGLRFCLFQFASKDLKFDKATKRWRNTETGRSAKNPMAFVEKWAPCAETLAGQSEQFVKDIVKPSEDIVVRNFHVVRKHLHEVELSKGHLAQLYGPVVWSLGHREVEQLRQEVLERMKEHGNEVLTIFYQEWEELLTSHLKAELRSSVLGAARAVTTLASKRVVERVRAKASKESQKKKRAKSKKKQRAGSNETKSWQVGLRVICLNTDSQWGAQGLWFLWYDAATQINQQVSHTTN